ncbi:MAG: glycosyltransferase [Anaerolineales bacterium]
MHIVIMSSGSRGDVRPDAPLGVGFKEAGHQVTLASHELFRDFVPGVGLAFQALWCRILPVSFLGRLGGPP